MAVGSILSKNKDGLIIDPFKYEYTFDKKYSSVVFLNMLYINSKTNGYIASASNKIYYADLWNGDRKLRFRQNCFYEDDEIASRLYLEMFDVAVTEKTAYYYIMNPNSKTNSVYMIDKWLGLEVFLRTSYFVSVNQ